MTFAEELVEGHGERHSGSGSTSSKSEFSSEDSSDSGDEQPEGWKDGDEASPEQLSRKRRTAVEMQKVDFTPSWAQAQSEDLSLLRLIIAVNNVTANSDKPEIPTQGTDVAGAAAEKLLRCINAIVEEKRAQFLHLRLQWLVFHLHSKTNVTEDKFKLPEALETPRSQHAQNAREAWWWNITNLGAQMKDLMVTDDPASSPRSSVGNSPRPGTAGTGSKVPSVRGEPDVTFKEELPESTLKRAAKVAACTPKLERRFGTADLSSSTAGMKRKPPEPSISPARLRAQTAPGNVGQTPKLMGMDSRLRAISAVHKASETVAVDTSQDVGKLQATADNMLHTKRGVYGGRPTSPKSPSPSAPGSPTERESKVKRTSARPLSREAQQVRQRRQSATLANMKQAFQLEDSRQQMKFAFPDEDEVLSMSPPDSPSNGNKMLEVPDIGKTWLIRGRTSGPAVAKGSPHSQSTKSVSTLRSPKQNWSATSTPTLREPLPGPRPARDSDDETLEVLRQAMSHNQAKVATGQAPMPLMLDRPRTTPAQQPTPPFLRGVEPISPGGTFKAGKTNPFQGQSRSWYCLVDNVDSYAMEHKIKCKATADFLTKGSSCPRRQLRIDSKLDVLCENEGIQGIRRYIRHICKNDLGLKADLSQELRTRSELPSLPRCGPKTRIAPPGAEESRTVSTVYAAMAARRKKIPQAPKCLLPVPPIPGALVEVAEKEDAMNLDLRGMNLLDDEAVPIVAGLRVQDCSFKTMLISGNPQLTDAFYEPLLKLACERSMSLLVLDLSGSAHMGEKSICRLADALPRALIRLRVLKLDGTRCEQSSWHVLLEGMRCLTYLQELGLADMSIGRRSQDVPCLVGELPASLPHLKKLNLSGNFFSFEGCRVLAQSVEAHTTLEHLDLSYNAGGFILTESGALPSTSASSRLFSSLRSDSRSQGIAAFNPISLICEVAGKCQSLKCLKLAGCQLNFDEDFILEDTFQLSTGSGIVDLDLSNNAFQGVMGVRCLLRILVTHPSLQNLHLVQIREALPSCVAIPYEQSDPTAHYDLNLEHPQHRALLRMLLRRTQKLSTPMQELFAFEERGDEVLQGWNKSQTVPHKGMVSFSFRFPMELGSDQDATTLISRINQKRKLKVGLVDFVKVAQLFNSLADVEARLLFLEAMAADLNLKLSHVRYLSELDPVLRGEVVDRLLPAVPEINTLGGFDLAVNSVHQKASLCRDRAAIVNLLLFNPACADGRYEFDVTEPAHRKMLDDLIIVNHWERDRAKRLGRPDLSKHGDHECIRNCSVNGNYRIWRSADVQLPPRAEIKFDYCSPFHPQRGTPSTPDRTVRLLRQALTTMDFNQSLKVKVLRSVAHRLVLTPEQCGWLLEALPATALELDTEIRDSPRVEAFVVLYARCNDIAELLSDEECGLYSLVHLTREEVLTVRKRLGRTRTWDIARAGQEFIIPPPEDPTDMNPAGRMVLMTRRASNAGPAAPGLPTTKPKSRTERMAEASIDEERMRPILKDYNMLDNPVSLGHANRYMMDLTLHEDWHCAQCLLRVCKEESGENIDAPFWSEKAHLADKGSKWLVPDEWSKEMPKVGIFGMTFLQGFNDPDLELRLRLAKEWLGW